MFASTAGLDSTMPWGHSLSDMWGLWIDPCGKNSRRFCKRTMSVNHDAEAHGGPVSYLPAGSGNAHTITVERPVGFTQG